MFNLPRRFFIVLQCAATKTVPGDRVDNDCDGVIDEEIKNNLDDDGDGLIDEDLTLVNRFVQS